jgi:hypothetical protein
MQLEWLEIVCLLLLLLLLLLLSVSCCKQLIGCVCFAVFPIQIIILFNPWTKESKTRAFVGHGQGQLIKSGIHQDHHHRLKHRILWHCLAT